LVGPIVQDFLTSTPPIHLILFAVSSKAASYRLKPLLTTDRFTLLLPDEPVATHPFHGKLPTPTFMRPH
jgi:hypothetical protein